MPPVPVDNEEETKHAVSEPINRPSRTFSRVVLPGALGVVILLFATLLVRFNVSTNLRTQVAPPPPPPAADEPFGSLTLPDVDVDSGVGTNKLDTQCRPTLSPSSRKFPASFLAEFWETFRGGGTGVIGVPVALAQFTPPLTTCTGLQSYDYQGPFRVSSTVQVNESPLPDTSPLDAIKAFCTNPPGCPKGAVGCTSRPSVQVSPAYVAFVAGALNTPPGKDTYALIKGFARKSCAEPVFFRQVPAIMHKVPCPAGEVVANAGTIGVFLWGVVDPALVPLMEALFPGTLAAMQQVHDIVLEHEMEHVSFIQGYFARVGRILTDVDSSVRKREFEVSAGGDPAGAIKKEIDSATSKEIDRMKVLMEFEHTALDEEREREKVRGLMRRVCCGTAWPTTDKKC